MKNKTFTKFLISALSCCLIFVASLEVKANLGDSDCKKIRSMEVSVRPTPSIPTKN
jgi:hypothetical protein